MVGYLVAAAIIHIVSKINFVSMARRRSYLEAKSVSDESLARIDALIARDEQRRLSRERRWAVTDDLVGPGHGATLDAEHLGRGTMEGDQP